MAISITATFRCDRCPASCAVGLYVARRPGPTILAEAQVYRYHLPDGWRCEGGVLMCWRHEREEASDQPTIRV